MVAKLERDVCRKGMDVGTEAIPDAIKGRLDNRDSRLGRAWREPRQPFAVP